MIMSLLIKLYKIELWLFWFVCGMYGGAFHPCYPSGQEWGEIVETCIGV